MFFPDKASIATVVPLDKGKANKNDILNYRPVSISNTFSKIYKNVIKEQLVSYMEKHFSSMSTYRKRHSTQRVHIRLLDEWRNKLDNNLFVEALADFSNISGCIAHDIMKAKLAAYRIKNET